MWLLASGLEMEEHCQRRAIPRPESPACVPLWELLSQWPHTVAPCSLPSPSILSKVLPGLDILSPAHP